LAKNNNNNNNNNNNRKKARKAAAKARRVNKKDSRSYLTRKNMTIQVLLEDFEGLLKDKGPAKGLLEPTNCKQDAQIAM
jgi:hypothetical protein